MTYLFRSRPHTNNFNAPTIQCLRGFAIVCDHMRAAQLVVTLCCTLGFAGGLIAPFARGASVELEVDTTRTLGEIDLTRFALGQGGLSDNPMIAPHIDQIAQLQPQTIRLFVQEYFDLNPMPGRYHWETLDKSIEAILATGSKPLLSLCFKPRVLYPKIDQDTVHPSDYKGWETLIFELVTHCNQRRNFGVEYWEVGNEPDIGEDGGCPYRFKPEDYVIYYTHTAQAILRADPKAKVGGPALAGYRSPVGDALIEHCAKGGAPLHFFSWHIYSNDPHHFRQSIQDVKGKLARHPALGKTETILDEWNMSLGNPVPAPGFQPAFVLETTGVFREERLTRSAYYHIRDVFVDRSKFASWMSAKGVDFMAHWWNVMPQEDGLWDNQGRLRPAYQAFRLLSLIRGKELPVSGATAEIKAFAARNGSWNHLVFWNFPSRHPDENAELSIRFSSSQGGEFRFMKLNTSAPVSNLEVIRHGSLAELKTRPLRTTLEPYGVGWVEVR